MRVCIVGESPQSPTGFGTQTKYLGKAFEDYGNETTAHAAFVAMLEKSECPLVKAYIQTVKDCFVKQNLEELEIFSEAA